ncbi:MAG: DNA ligase D [Alphaproteobacteria bacterium]|nr:DNA ligase D [Rhizobiaceae bacterium]MBU3961834.1 DNA ligase D [Alphaproteobacteria bacterium]MBU4050458.1 DNA ligase D [Alphaproteobacteria bacterium]MBU4091255.1 DNA ligase D [Alphaproteobacteria bacterium]MBU4158367.1 DNA ligase D [Alphaproteobacteria bacterium]
MSLDLYRRKRDFKATPEPKGKASRARGDSFVIQKHAARRLHYDFRLEMDGVLKSWAVTRGPSLVPGEKRLAVHVEDHPLDYGDFEGTIPGGHYGAGSVIVWDRGRWTPIGDVKKAYRKGHLEFELEGEKLSGRWHLVRMAGRQDESRENWLLIKGEDDAARGEDDPDILEERPESVKTGLQIEQIGEDAPAKARRPARKPAAGKRATAEETKSPSAPDVGPGKINGAVSTEKPDFVEPALATAVKTVPKGKRWLHEIKLDGYRMQAHLAKGKVTLLTRTGLDWTERFGKAIGKALAALPASEAVIDGEVVVENGAGTTDFSLLQADLSDGRTERFVFYGFDLLYLDGFDLRPAALSARKSALKGLMEKAGPPLKFSDHFDESGDLVLKHACRLSLEGIVSKVADAPYRSGRGRDWVKSKCSARQEVVIGGYVPSSVSKGAIGSLVMGTHDDGKLVHIGRVGTGYTEDVARRLMRTLEPLRQDKSPFSDKLTGLQKKDVVFVRPETVAEIEFRGWTADAHLRHASFRGLREDKAARDVVRESEMKTTPTEPKRTVNLTHPDRVYWPDAGVTKAGLADYYVEVWPRMAPFVVNRPLALLRCPEGVGGSCFFQKHAWRGMRKDILVAPDPTQPDEEPNVVIRDLDGLLGLVQGGVLEIHPWGATLDALEKPDMVNIDLDPGPGVSWERVIAAAFEVRERFEAMGLTAFVKTSGGKGLHVVAPVKPKTEWPEVKAAMKALADGMAKDSPSDYVSTVTKAKRKGKILIDYLRNGRGATAVAPYSPRARDGAPVSMPLSWEELGPEIGPAHFTIGNAITRLSGLAQDPWADFRAAEAVLPPATGTKRKSR